MSWIHYLLCDHHWTQCRHAISNTGHVTQIRILEDPRWPPKRCWQDVRQGYLTVVCPWCWKGSDLMCRHSVIFSISLSVGFLDSLHDPSAYVAPHNISDVAIPVYKHPLTPQRHLDIMLAASLESPFALRMARSVSTCVDLTAGSDESWSPCRLSKRLASAGLDLRRTAGLDLHGTDPLTPETTTLPVAVERSKSPWLLVTKRSSAKLEGPSWMAGTCTGGPSRCPTAWTWHLSTLP